LGIWSDLPTLKIDPNCKETKDTIWLSSRLYSNMIQDRSFDKKILYFKDDNDNYKSYPICTFELDNNEKWLLTSINTAKNIAYLPFTKHIVYTNNKDIKEKLYLIKGLDNWKQYIDYDDLGVFLLAKNISLTFLTSFFIFLITFMIMAFSSLAKEFESSIFLTKLYGLNIYRTIVLYTFFFFLYTFIIGCFVFIEYYSVSYLIGYVANFFLVLDLSLFTMILKILMIIGLFVSLFISIKYHRLPL